MSVAALVHDGEASGIDGRAVGATDPVVSAAWLVVLAFRLRDEEALLTALRRLTDAFAEAQAEDPSIRRLPPAGTRPAG